MITNLEVSTYVKRAESRALPSVAAGVLGRFVITDQQMKRTVWQRNVREWARVHATEKNSLSLTPARPTPDALT